MASPAARFEAMLSNIMLTDKERTKAIDTHTYMRDQLERRRHWIKETFLTGSYKRETAIRPLNDVDFFCVVDPDWARGKTPAHIQREVQRVLQEIYPRTTVDRQKHSLGVDFSSQTIGYDVIPAVPTRGYYQIVHRESGDGEFILSNPGAVEREKVAANSQGGPGGRMLQMIRLMKHWNTKNHKKVKSFHLELLCYKAAAILKSCSNNREACYRLFQFLSSKVVEDCFVPGVPVAAVSGVQQNNLRDTRTDSQLRNFAGELGAAGRRAGEALSLETTNPAQAHQIWRSLFGGEVY